MGATSGMGLRLAEVYAAKGWRVGVAGRNERALKQLKEMFPGQIEWMEIDVNRKDASGRLLNLIKKLGGMDIYLHSSGIYHENPDLDIGKDVAIAETNAVGFTRMIDTAYRFFRMMNGKGGRGHIVVITSVAGTKGIGKLASYSASKRYQQNYIQALEQLARQEGLGIDFTDIRPGWVRTPLLDKDRSYRMSMDLDEVVPMIVTAIRRRTRIAVIDRRWAAAVFFWRLLPGRLWIKLPITISTPKEPGINS